MVASFSKYPVQSSSGSSKRHQFLSRTDMDQLQNAIMRPARIFGRRDYLSDQQKICWLIEKGVVRTLSYLDDNSTVTLGIWSEGDLVGRPLSRVNSYMMECITEVVAVPVNMTEWTLPSHQVISYWQETELLLIARASRRVEAALLHILQWLAQRFGQHTNNGMLIDLKITHQDLADLSGTTRVTVTRLLRQFEKQGLITRASRQLILSQDAEHWHYEI